MLQKTHIICEEDKNSLQQELQSREQRLQQEVSDRRRMEQRMHGILEDTKLKWEKECVSGACGMLCLMLFRFISWCTQHEACPCAGPPCQCHPHGDAQPPLGEGGEVKPSEGHHTGAPHSRNSSSVTVSVSAAALAQHQQLFVHRGCLCL